MTAQGIAGQRRTVLEDHGGTYLLAKAIIAKNPRTMIREILDPSAQISDQFRTHLIRTKSGRVHEGRIINRTDTELTVAADPKRPSSVVQIPLAEVDRMIPSKVSMMPKDLLNTLKLEEILDLLAYIESAGDPGSDVFQD